MVQEYQEGAAAGPEPRDTEMNLAMDTLLDTIQNGEDEAVKARARAGPREVTLGGT